MFSDSRATTPGEQRGFKPHAPHFIPWLRNSLKAQHGGGDLGLNGPCKSSSEARNALTPLERAKGIGFFSIQGKERAKKGELRCNGIGMLPVVLRGHHILPGSLGKQKEGGPARWDKTKHRDPSTQPEEGLRGDSSTTLYDNFTKNHRSKPSLRQVKDDTTSVRKYGPLVGPPPTPVPVLLAERPDCEAPVVVCMEDGEGKVWDYSSRTTYRQRDLHTSSWLSSDTQHGFSSSFSYVNKHGNSQSQRDLREGALKGPLNGLIFSTEIPHRGLSCTTSLRGPRKPRPTSEHVAVLGQNQTWVQRRPNTEEDPQRKGAGCTRKVVRNQIKRVMDNLEQVLTSLRDIQQEMKEVVQQIDYLTSSIDLDEEEGEEEEEEEEQRRTGGDSKPQSDRSYSSGSSSTEVTVIHQRPPGAKNQLGPTEACGSVSRDHHGRSRSPQNAQLTSISSGFLSEKTRTLRLTCGSVSTLRKGGPQHLASTLPPSDPPPIPNLPTYDHVLSPRRSMPNRPPTPGLSPLTVNLHHPGSPGSQPRSPGATSSIRICTVSPPSPLSPKPYPPPALSLSVIIETKVGSNQTPQGDLPSAGPLSLSLSPPQSKSCPPTNSETQTSSLDDRERRASSAGPSHVSKPPAAQGRRGRKPPPYPHSGLSEPTKKVKEPRKAPPYPERRRLLSTTV